MNESERDLLRMNLELAKEVDMLKANLDYLRDMSVIMCRLFRDHNVPYPKEEFVPLEEKLAKQLNNIETFANQISEMHEALYRMQNFENSSGMRTGNEAPKPVTEECIENILRQIDQEN